MVSLFWKIVYPIGVIFWFYWSKLIYQKFIEGKKEPVKGYENMNDLNIVLTTTTWVKDGLKEAGDAMGSAGRFQYLLNHNETPESGRDCDEFAVYAYESGKLTKGRHHMVCCLTVNWLVPWFWKFRRPRGHNVCVYADYNELGHPLYYHTGNWGPYPKPGQAPYTNIQDIALDVWRVSNRRYSSDFLGYSTWEPGQLLPPDTNTGLYGVDLPR